MMPGRRSLGEEALRWKQLKAERARKSAQEEMAPIAQDSETGPPLEADTEDPPVSSLAQLLQDPSVRIQRAAEVFETVEQQDRQSNKENIRVGSRPRTFIDWQETAQRLSFDDGTQDTLSHHRPGQLPLEKRQRSQTESGDDKDDFEARAGTAADGRRNELRTRTNPQQTYTVRSSSYRPRTEIPESIYSNIDVNDDPEYFPDHEQDYLDQQLHNTHRHSSAVQPSRRALSASQQPRPSSQRLPSSGQGPPPYTRHSRSPSSQKSYPNPLPSSSAPVSTALQLVREKARHKVASNQPHRLQSRPHRPPKGRLPYSAAEEDRFIELIEEHGAHYSLLKQIDDVEGSLLRERSQVQLKDKAQELKFQMLKAGAPLPANFEKIPLRKRMREQLEELGIYEVY